MRWPGCGRAKYRVGGNEQEETGVNLEPLIPRNMDMACVWGSLGPFSVQDRRSGVSGDGIDDVYFAALLLQAEIAWAFLGPLEY